MLSPYLLSIHLLSVSLALGLSCTQASVALATLGIQPHLLSGQFHIRPHLLSKRLLSSLNCYQCASAIQNEFILSKFLAIKIRCFLNKLLSKPVLSCYHKLVAFSISCYQNQFLVAIKTCCFLNKLLSKPVLSCHK